MTVRDAIKLVGISKSFDLKGDTCINVLTDINLKISNNELVAITGRSGSGKSTLLHIMSGLTKPTSGSVFINGRDISLLSEKDVEQFRNCEIGFVFQSFFLEPAMTAWENVSLPLIVQKKSIAERRGRALAALELVGLTERANHKPAELSGGEVQRVCIARSIINNPKIIFADEPTGNLDKENSSYVMKLLRSLVSPTTAVVLVTHNQEDALLCDRIMVLSDGKVIS